MSSRRRDDLPYPWRWCSHRDAVRCDHCGQRTYPQTRQVAEKAGGYHYHAECALEIALEYIGEKEHDQ